MNATTAMVMVLIAAPPVVAAAEPAPSAAEPDAAEPDAAEPDAAEPVAAAGPLASAGQPVASADGQLASADVRWPGLPPGKAPSLEDQITDHLTELGNLLGQHLDLLSDDMLRLTVDGRRRRATIRLGGGDPQGLMVRLDSDVQFDDINAHIHSRVDLGFHGHRLNFDLPDVDMSPCEYRGDYGVEVRLPVFVMSF
jgi:hypothetical protein